jgi:hypothetical protein
VSASGRAVASKYLIKNKFYSFAVVGGGLTQLDFDGFALS